MSNDPRTSNTLHSEYNYNLARLDLTLPQGISRQDTFTATSRLGAFSEANLKSIGDALERREFLSRAEAVALALGSLSETEVNRFLPRHGCLQHSPVQVTEFLGKLHELNRDYGAAELARVGIRSITPSEIEAAKEVSDYVALLPRLGYRRDNVYLSLLTRAACLDPNTSEEWPTVELAHASRTIDQNPTAQRNLPIWHRLETAGATPSPDSIRRITQRWMHDPDVHEPI
jgi:hypothetical protein